MQTEQSVSCRKRPHPPQDCPKQADKKRKVGPVTRIQQFARQGGPDLSGLRGVSCLRLLTAHRFYQEPTVSSRIQTHSTSASHGTNTTETYSVRSLSPERAQGHR
jgi:hypothetical protein